MIELEAGTIAKLQPGSNDVADMFLPTRAILAAVGNKVTGLGVTTGGNKLDLDRSIPTVPAGTVTPMSVRHWAGGVTSGLS